MNKKRVKKCALIIAIFSISLLCGWGYWEYLGYKFEQDPLYYYEPSPYIKFLWEWDEEFPEDSLDKDSLYISHTL